MFDKEVVLEVKFKQMINFCNSIPITDFEEISASQKSTFSWFTISISYKKELRPHLETHKSNSELNTKKLQYQIRKKIYQNHCTIFWALSVNSQSDLHREVWPRLYRKQSQMMSCKQQSPQTQKIIFLTKAH